MRKSKTPIGALTVLRNAKKDIMEMETHSVEGNLVLVPKADVLELIQTQIEYCLNPEDTVLATEDE